MTDETVDQALDRIMALLDLGADDQYGDEEVTQLAHALQAAELAQEAGSAPSLVAAALLHDIGHLVDTKAKGASAAGIDRQHEQIGAQFLTRWFDAAVVEPIRLHVAAKRYLCTREPGYYEGLSDASKRSLALQGGPFSPAEADAFLSQPHAEAAVQLRWFDEGAKIIGKSTPDAASYRPLLLELMAR